MTRFVIALRTQPADPTRGDILYVDGHFIDASDHSTQLEIVTKLSKLALNGVTKEPGVRVSRRGHAALTQVNATAVGAESFHPAITVALMRSSHGLELSRDDMAAHVQHFAASNGYDVHEADVRSKIESLVRVLTRKRRPLGRALGVRDDR